MGTDIPDWVMMYRQPLAWTLAVADAVERGAIVTGFAVGSLALLLPELHDRVALRNVGFRDTEYSRIVRWQARKP